MQSFRTCCAPAHILAHFSRTGCYDIVRRVPIVNRLSIIVVDRQPKKGLKTAESI